MTTLSHNITRFDQVSHGSVAILYKRGTQGYTEVCTFYILSFKKRQINEVLRDVRFSKKKKKKDRKRTPELKI